MNNNENKNNEIEDAVTVVITACNRPDLLDITLSSFLKYNKDCPLIKKIIVSEDSGIPNVNKDLEEKYRVILKDLNLPDILWLNAEKRNGQIKSIDKAYSYVETPYIFHLEEDWENLESGVIEESLKILKMSDKISAVMCRAYGEGGYYLCKDKEDGIPYLFCDRQPWGYYSFNPGLRRLKDYKELFNSSYNSLIEFDRKDPARSETVINNFYRDRGYFMAMTEKPSGYFKDIGMYRHVF